MTPIIRVTNVTKVYDGLKALDSVSFEVERGEIFGLLGPNGAGKTSLIKILTTVIKPTSGKAEIDGHDVVKSAGEVRKRIGVVFQETTLDNDLTVYENLDFHARLYGMNKKDRLKRIGEVLSLVELEDYANTLVRKLSGGMKRKLEIARGILHKPKVLFLDEPTLGLDVHTRRKIWKHIEELRKEGVTVFITTHYMEEADRLCDRVAIIDRGRIVAIDTPSNLKRMVGGDVVRIEFEGEFDLRIKAKKIVKGENFVEITVEDCERVLPEILRAFKVVKSISIRRPTLEDAFVTLTGRELK
ncbi:daunorubicin resistance protein DrrA family ABC transporter ATP-binding protein [Archaeoglobus profundus]|uniref:Daunorubicin resistance ABC transporter ATPase subunit n=1 Tax=Archaeoglobus profundus (strain DSM 5631 / JCM 9629 / NBRC 100127 / Av18) TaxID=572546 RepID=D2RDZ5_ARCPA|nr:daunorubicin resistance protein DrrA family ABC transporter ATP-binding protein [Archaeoglobus profundus]ADB58339.1 daunorubicin resistance ABC transporter ATPase subunit [Archaeoglobus profundus DSM 5631]